MKFADIKACLQFAKHDVSFTVGDVVIVSALDVVFCVGYIFIAADVIAAHYFVFVYVAVDVDAAATDAVAAVPDVAAIVNATLAPDIVVLVVFTAAISCYRWCFRSYCYFVDEAKCIFVANDILQSAALY